MAKRRKKRIKRKKIEDLKPRCAVALSAILATGAGKHGDRRLRRKRTRAAQKRAAIAEHS